MPVGWQFTPGLPCRWLTREFNGQRQFMSDANKIFKSFAEAHQFLSFNKDQFKLEERKKFYSIFSKKQNSKTKSLKTSKGQQQQLGGIVKSYSSASAADRQHQLQEHNLNKEEDKHS